MKTVKLKKKKAKYEMGGSPKKSHYSIVIDEDCILIDGDKLISVYIKIPQTELLSLRKVALNTKYSETYRTSSLPTKSSVFGSQPRNALRNDYCRLTINTIGEVDNFKRLLKFQDYLCRAYKKHIPKAYKHELGWANNNIDKDYLFGVSPYTSINVNVNHAIKYHIDKGNVKNSYSNIIIVKNNISGGELVFPDYGVALSQNDGFMAIIRGQEVTHGVMPIKQTSGKDYYRASIVYYTSALMRKCLPYTEELKRLQQIKVTRARNRAYN